MDTVTFSVEQFNQLLEVLIVDSFITMVMAMLFALFLWDAFGYLFQRFYLMLKVRHLKRQQDASEVLHD